MRLPMPIAVNADSLATWLAPALAAVSAVHAVSFDLLVEDQDHSSELLRQGRAMAAITADPRAVQGCAAVRLGAMRYVAVASPAFMAQHFAGGLSAATLARAPCTVFNRKDALQARFLRRLTRQALNPPQHHVPSTHGFIHAALHGLGWGMNPQALVAPLLARGELVELVPGMPLDVPLVWQHWRLDSDVMHLLTRSVRAAAAAMLQR
jgi:LysR family transcriptional regulator, chromosome initiation inhibitor